MGASMLRLADYDLFRLSYVAKCFSVNSQSRWNSCFRESIESHRFEPALFDISFGKQDRCRNRICDR